MDMDLPTALIILVISVSMLILGTWIGSQRGHPWIGFLLTAILGPIGLIIACLLPKSDRAAARSRSRSDGSDDIALHLHLMSRQRALLAERTDPAAHIPTLPLRIRRAGQELGAWTVPQIKEYLHTGNLTPEDDYYDLQARDWLPIAAMPW